MKRIFSSVWLWVVVIVLLPFAAYEAVSLLKNKYDHLPVFSTMNDQHFQDYRFINQYNQVQTLDNWKGKIVVTDFFFTSCPSICPKMTDNMKKIGEAFRDDKKIQLISFTIDPQRDSAQRLMQYAKAKDDIMPDWTFLTGEKKDIYKIARKQFYLTASGGDGGPEDFIHSDKIVLRDIHNRIRGYYDGIDEIQIQQLINDIKKLKNED